VRVDVEDLLRLTNRNMVVFDLLLGTSALLAPAATMRALGHAEPSPDAREVFRRNAPIWFTFAAGHLAAYRNDGPSDWWALSWLRATEIGTDALWARSPYFTRPGARAGLVFAGVANLAMTIGFRKLAQNGTRRRSLFRR
jgi:hypothetical protein